MPPELYEFMQTKLFGMIYAVCIFGLGIYGRET